MPWQWPAPARILHLFLDWSSWGLIAPPWGGHGLGTLGYILRYFDHHGLSIALTRIGWLASLVQIAGGCYLIYLGVNVWLGAKHSPSPERQGSAHETALHGLRTGIIVNLANPKVITFFLSLYAVTVPVGSSVWTKLALLTGGFLLEVLWYGLIIVLLSTPPARAAYDRAGQWIERAVGTALAVFGFRLISEKL